MYSMFSARGKAPHKPGEDLKKPVKSSSRRNSTANACLECRRRKIRCDGNKPCRQCLWNRRPDGCSYAPPRERIVPSRVLIANLTKRAQQCEDILEKLFPQHSPDELQDFSRDELLGLAVDSAIAPASSDVDSSATEVEVCGSGPVPGEEPSQMHIFNGHQMFDRSTQNNTPMRWATSWTAPAVSVEVNAAWHAKPVPRGPHSLPTIDSNVPYPMTPSWSPPETTPVCPVPVQTCWGDGTAMVQWNGMDIVGPMPQPPGPHFIPSLAPVCELGGSVCGY